MPLAPSGAPVFGDHVLVTWSFEVFYGWLQPQDHGPEMESDLNFDWPVIRLDPEISDVMTQYHAWSLNILNMKYFASSSTA